ncbi:hypothetical protein OQA88_10813 [Cercophora sp. LCS_1]
MSPKPLRQLAAEKAHGKGANPSQLGDPISLKSETSSADPPQTDSSSSLPTSTRPPPPSSGGSHEEKKLRSGHHVRGMLTPEIKAGKVPPPSKTLEGDATSLEREKPVNSSKL